MSGLYRTRPEYRRMPGVQAMNFQDFIEMTEKASNSPIFTTARLTIGDCIELSRLMEESILLKQQHDSCNIYKDAFGIPPEQFKTHTGNRWRIYSQVLEETLIDLLDALETGNSILQKLDRAKEILGRLE